MASLLHYLQKALLFIVKYVLSRAILLAVFVGLFLWLAQFGYNFLTYMKTPMITTEMPVLVEVKPGMNSDALLRELKAKIPSTDPNFLKIYGRLTGTLSDIKAGEYEITDQMRPADFWTNVIKGRSMQYGFTLVEGLNFKQMRDAMINHPNIVQTIPKDATPDEIMALIGYKGQPYEGYFMPETYLFPRGYTDVELLKRSYESMQQFVNQVWEKRDLDLPIKNQHELLTLASIIEKETGVAHERPEIAGVFVRRLQKGMRLQTDPTVIYGLGDRYRGTIYRSDLQRDTPYNTYTRNGLPPTPIAMPSVAAVYAAANPKEGNSLYFVAKGDGSGEHIFSATLEQHNQAVRNYRARLNNGN